MAEESGIVDAVVTGTLDTSDAIADAQLGHFFVCASPSPLDAWALRTADDGGHVFRFFWWPLERLPDRDWHPVFVRAFNYIASAVR